MASTRFRCCLKLNKKLTIYKCLEHNWIASWSCTFLVKTLNQNGVLGVSLQTIDDVLEIIYHDHLLLLVLVLLLDKRRVVFAHRNVLGDGGYWREEGRQRVLNEVIVDRSWHRVNHKLLVLLLTLALIG